MDEQKARIYLDHNASSPLRPEALEQLRRAYQKVRGNPSSLHLEGREARKMLDEARREVSRLAGCSVGEVVFTGSGSEAVAAAIRGVCDRAPHGMRRLLFSAVEHSCVMEAAKLTTRQGFVMVEIPCGPEGRVDVERFRMNLGEGVALAALQLANNETGVLQPVEEIGKACRKAGVPLLVDVAQAAGKIPLEPQELFADLLTISGHKFGGPQGSGALIVRSGISLAPLVGGLQERRRRGGSEAVAALAALGAAAAAALADMREDSKRLLRLRAKIETRLRELYPDIHFHGQASPRLPNTVNFSIPGLPGEALAIALDLAGIAVSTGSACASGAVEPSHVIKAMGFSDEEAKSAVRVSLGWSTTPDEIDIFLERFPQIVEQVREGLG
jgi:cysteine desulfurase